MTTLMHHHDKDKILHQVLMAIGAIGKCWSRPFPPYVDAVINAPIIVVVAAGNIENVSRLIKSKICEAVDNILTRYSSHAEPELIYGSCFRVVTGLVSQSPAAQERFYGISTFTKNVVKGKNIPLIDRPFVT